MHTFFSVAALVLFGVGVVPTMLANVEKIDTPITLHEPENHNRYGYRFSVGGKSYEGWIGSQGAVIGEIVHVYYDPLDPAINNVISFDKLAEDRRGAVYSMSAGSAVLAAIAALTVAISARRSAIGGWRLPIRSRRPSASKVSLDR